MSRGMCDTMSTETYRQCVDKEGMARELWYKSNRDQIWNCNIRPICCRVQAICGNKEELSRQLMDSKDEYFRYCQVPPMKWPSPPACCPAGNPSPAPFFCEGSVAKKCLDCCDECCQNPLIPMKCVPECQMGLLFQGISHDGGGAKGYLKNRWNSGLPEYRFCRPPTVNSEYAWRIQDHLQCMRKRVSPRINVIGPAFTRHNGVLQKADCAPFHFP